MMRLSRWIGWARPPLQGAVELCLPSELGYEKLAMDTVATVARRMGFDGDRIDALRSAIAEAVTNAIEHGNRGVKDALVRVQILPAADRLTIAIRDQGAHRLPKERITRVPNLSRAMDGSDEGWGIWLMRQLVDEVEWTASPSGGNEVRLVVYTRTGEERSGGGAHGVSG